MNLLSRDDIDEGGAVFALLTLATLAWMGVYTIALLLNVSWWVALPITVMLLNAVKAIVAVITREADRWWTKHDARHPERNRPPDPDGHRMAKSYERMYRRMGKQGIECFERAGGYEGHKASHEAEMQRRLDEWLEANPPAPPPEPWHRSTVDAITEKNRERRKGLDARRRPLDE